MKPFFILRMTVLGRGLIFQPVLLACTYTNDTIITLQGINSTLQIFHQSLHTQKSGHGIKTEHAKRYKMTKVRSK